MAITEQDRHDLHQRLDEVLGTAPATTLMEHLPPVGWADVTTKRDLDHVDVLLRTDIATVRSAMEAEFTQVRTEMESGFKEVRAEMQALRSDLLGAIQSQARRQTMWLVSVMSLFVALAGVLAHI